MINRILLYNSGGGIGDSVQIMPLINTLRLEFKDAKFYLLSSHKNYFNSKLLDFKSPIEPLDLNIKYFGFRWWHALIIKNKLKKYNIDSFDLILDLQTKVRNSLILKIIPHKFFISLCFIFKPKISFSNEFKINYKIIKALNYFLKSNFKLHDFDISKIDKKFNDEAIKLLPKKNYVGLSITQGNIYRKKQWSINNVVKLSNKLTDNNKIPVFFIEKKNYDLKNKIAKLVPHAMFPEHQTSMSSPALVTCLGKRLDFVITIDNGIMHMLALSKVPMISLFGPTDSRKFAPTYKNSIILDAKKIYNSKNIENITVEDVLRAAKQFASF
jgi:ADP-heptose:LPS heptosyltransferase